MRKNMSIEEIKKLEPISLEDSKKLMLMIMDVIHQVCLDNDINYSLGGGSMIGAVRHKGFIPWDDDIDIFMLREDYNRFITAFSNQKEGRYKLLSLETDSEYNLAFAKVIDTETVLIEEVDDAIPMGVYVDVFPIDNCPGDYDDSVKFMESFNAIRWLSNFKMIRRDHKRKWWKNVILDIGRIIANCYSQRKIAETISNKIQKYKGKQTEYVAELALNPYKRKEIWRSDCFKDYIYIEFEGKNYKCTSNYDEVLRTTFGDYMQLPPEEKRVTHHDSSSYWLYKREVL